MSRSARLAVAASAATLILAAGCAPAGSNSDGDGPADGAPLKIGYVGALSGGSAANGQADLNGVLLAIEQINDDGGVAGHPLEIVTADDKSDPATSATQTQKLIEQDGVVAILGGPNSGTARANAVIATDAGIPRIFTIAQEDTLIDPSLPGFPLTFRTTENNSYDVGALAAVFKDRAYSAICVLADTTAYGDGGLVTIERIFGEEGLSIASVARHEVNATDMTAQALTLQNAGCDSIYLYSLGPDAALFLKTLEQIGWSVPVIGGRGLAAKSFLSLAGEAANGVVIPAVVDPSKPEGADFIEAYDAKYGADDDPAHVYSAVGYSSVLMLAEAFRISDGQTGEALATALTQVSLSNAPIGRAGSTLSWTTTRHEAPSEDYLVLYTIEDEKFTFLTSDISSGS